MSVINLPIKISRTEVNGKITYRLGNVIHRDDGPAVIHPNGTQEWYCQGKRHRARGPAIINASGKKCYYRNGKLHSWPGPAVINADGTMRWYRHGERCDAPFIIKLGFLLGLKWEPK